MVDEKKLIPAGFRAVQRNAGIWKENQDSFLEETTPRKGQESAYEALMAMLNNEKLIVSLIGESRAGKSWLLSGCINSSLKRNFGGWDSEMPCYMTFFELELELRSAMTLGTMNQLFNKLVKYPLLMIDEIGRGKWSDFTATFFENLIIKRFGEKKRTGMGTNLSAEEFKNMFDMAILERFRSQSICLVKREK